MYSTHNAGDDREARQKLEQARAWAGEVSGFDESLMAGPRAAADIIRSLPDHWIDAGELRGAIEECDKMTYPYEVIEHIEKTVLTPPPTTLADLEPEEVAQHFGKHVRVIDRPGMPPIMLLAVRAGEALVLIDDSLRFWPYTDTWPLEELALTEQEEKQP